jgi:hypothetical protein
MPASALQRFTVPLNTSDSASAQGMLMPKLKYRFRVMFEGFGVSSPTTELTKQVIDFKRPDVSFEDIVLDVYNSKIKLAGKHNWSDATVTLRDDATGAASRLVGEQLQKQFDFYEQSSAASGIDYKFVTRCEMLDGGNGSVTPNVLETWVLHGCYLKQADYGDVNYSSGTDPVTITLTIAFDNALQLPLDTGGIGIPGVQSTRRSTATG